MSNRGKGQVQRDAEQRLSKLEALHGEGDKEPVLVHLYDFHPGHPAPPDMINERTGDLVRIVLHPWGEDEEQ